MALGVDAAGPTVPQVSDLRNALADHWPEYMIEAAGLGIFMIVAAVSDTILEYPGSPVREAISNPPVRRVFMGLAMGLTAIAVIYSPWGRHSGAHLNPAVTLAFFRLGKVLRWDAVFYVLAQFLRGLAGVLVVLPVLGKALADPRVNYVVTVPGSVGPAVAFVAEFLMSFGLMGVVLVASNSHRFAHLTGLFAGLLLLVYITVEAPYSGMSINPARTLASALPARVWKSIWIYLTAPPLGMLAAAEVFVRLARTHEAICAKLHHDRSVPVDYPDYAEAVGQALPEGRADLGILICGSGVGASVATPPKNFPNYAAGTWGPARSAGVDRARWSPMAKLR